MHCQVISVGPVWEESGLNEHSSDYVDEICDRYAQIWHSLSSPPSALPRGILEVAWEHICEGGFLSLLEGYSKVPYCSTEGRSLMSMDLAAFADGIDAVSIIHRLEADDLASAPPRVSPKRGTRYVDMYIKVFYYPEEVSAMLLFLKDGKSEGREARSQFADLLPLSGRDEMDCFKLHALSVESHVGFTYLRFQRPASLRQEASR